MGCDIHLHVEVKINGKWHHYSCPSVDRSYRLFAKMADVRNSDCYGIEPISTPKGLPDDVTELTKFCFEVDWGEDAHSVSYLTSGEIVELQNWGNDYLGRELPGGIKHWFMEEEFGYLFGNSFTGFYEEGSGYYPEGLEDFRFVFWFDN